jgi:hypothetical protein
VEVVAWNIAEQSETFDNVAWVKTTDGQVTISANATTAPNGTLTADKMIASANAGFHCVAQTQSLVAGVFTISIYAKASEYTFLQIFDSLTTDFANFNLTTGAVATVDQYTATIENVGNGWYRCTATKTNPSGNFVFRYGIVTTGTATRGESFTGNGVNGLFIWGAQLNIGSTAKPYFPTTDRLNVPRLTYQNGGGGCPSLLLEKQSTNVFAQSNTFTSVGDWYIYKDSGSTFTQTSNYGISPDGTQNATRLQASITAGVYANYARYFTVTIGTTYTYSIYIKSLSGTPTIRFVTPNGSAQSITLTTNWERYTYTFTASSADFYGNFYIESPTSSSYDLLTYGAQLEASSYPTSYIPTTSASATRVADACSKTGISSLIGQTSGSVFFDFTVDTISAQTSDPVLWYMKDGGAGERYVELYSNGNLIYVEIDGGGPIATITKSALTVGRHKCAIAYATNDFVFYVDGVQVGTDTIGTPNGFSTFGLQYYISAYTGQQKVNQVALFPTRLTNAELASLTTL